MPFLCRGATRKKVADAGAISSALLLDDIRLAKLGRGSPGPAVALELRHDLTRRALERNTRLLGACPRTTATFANELACGLVAVGANHPELVTIVDGLIAGSVGDPAAEALVCLVDVAVYFSAQELAQPLTFWDIQARLRASASHVLMGWQRESERVPCLNPLPKDAPSSWHAGELLVVARRRGLVTAQARPYLDAGLASRWDGQAAALATATTAAARGSGSSTLSAGSGPLGSLGGDAASEAAWETESAVEFADPEGFSSEPGPALEQPAARRKTRFKGIGKWGKPSKTAGLSLAAAEVQRADEVEAAAAAAAAAGGEGGEGFDGATAEAGAGAAAEAEAARGRPPLRKASHLNPFGSKSPPPDPAAPREPHHEALAFGSTQPRATYDPDAETPQGSKIP